MSPTDDTPAPALLVPTAPQRVTALMRELKLEGLAPRVAMETALETAAADARRAALREAAALALRERDEYRANASRCDASGNHFGGTVDTAGALACERIAFTLERLAAGEGRCPDCAGRGRYTEGGVAVICCFCDGTGRLAAGEG